MGTTAAEKFKTCCSHQCCAQETEQIEVKPVQADITSDKKEMDSSKEERNKDIIAVHIKEKSTTSSSIKHADETSASKQKKLEEIVATAPRIMLRVRITLH